MIVELFAPPSDEQTDRARKFLESVPYTTTAVLALAAACEALDEGDNPAWTQVTNVLLAAARLVAEAEADAV